MQELNCLKAKFSSVNKADAQEMPAVAYQSQNELGYTALMDQEIAEAVKPEDEDNKGIKEFAIPSHDKAFVCLSMCIQWLEARTNCDLSIS